VKAQDAFQQLTVNYPTSNYVDTAYFYAGRAAFAHQDYVTARTLLEKVPDSSPSNPVRASGKVASTRNSLNFTQALPLYDAVLATEKTGSRFVEASLYKGECLFELGAKDPASYALAQTAFNQILDGKEGSVAERNEAAVRSAKCLEKWVKLMTRWHSISIRLWTRSGRCLRCTHAARIFSGRPKPDGKRAACAKRKKIGAAPSRFISDSSKPAAHSSRNFMT